MICNNGDVFIDHSTTTMPRSPYTQSVKPLWLLLMALWMSLSPALSGEGCSSTFHVWQADQNVVHQLERAQLVAQNLSSFCQAQVAMSEAKVLEHLVEVVNTTVRLEREMTALHITRMDGQLQATKMAAEISNLRRELDNSNRRVDDLELDLYMLRTRERDASPRYEREQISNDMASLLKNSVGDLKAEWLLMKREIETLKLDTQRLKQQHDATLNKSYGLQGDVTACTLHFKTLEKRILRGEDQLLKLESRFTKMLADFDEVKDSFVDLRLETDAQRNEMATLLAGNIRTQTILHELQVESNRLQDQMNSFSAGHPSERKDTGHPEEKEPSVPYSSAGDDFIARDCHELYQTGKRSSGLYYIQPTGAPYLLPVYCLMLNRTGFTVFQRRIDGLLNFNRRWLEYQHGFGNPYGEFWLGNDMLHLLTSQKQYTLRVELVDWEGKRYWAEFSHFTIADASDHYRLRVSGYSGDAGDSFSYHDNMAFSTEDVDNDLHTRHCAAENQGGWWFHSCFSSNLNGVYHRAWYSQTSSNYADGVVWYTLKDSEFYSLKGVQMMLKPKIP